MPDGKTYVGMTDTSDMLQIDIETLKQYGKIKWEDDLDCTMGTTHVKYLKNGDLVGSCGEISSRGENSLTAYKITKDNIRKRIKLGTVKTEQSVYQHAFGLSEDYATLFQHPVNFDLYSEVVGFDMISSMKFSKNETTKIHAIKTDGSGDVQTFDTGIFF